MADSPNYTHFNPSDDNESDTITPIHESIGFTNESPHNNDEMVEKQAPQALAAPPTPFPNITISKHPPQLSLLMDYSTLSPVHCARLF